VQLRELKLRVNLDQLQNQRRHKEKRIFVSMYMKQP
jgi:hypothetical protein